MPHAKQAYVPALYTVIPLTAQGNGRQGRLLLNTGCLYGLALLAYQRAADALVCKNFAARDRMHSRGVAVRPTTLC